MILDSYIETYKMSVDLKLKQLVINKIASRIKFYLFNDLED